MSLFDSYFLKNIVMKKDRYYNEKTEDVIIIKRHFVLLFIKILKFVFLILVAFFLYFIYVKYLANFEKNSPDLFTILLS